MKKPALLSPLRQLTLAGGLALGLAGCAGQLELPPEAYAVNAGASNQAGAPGSMSWGTGGQNGGTPPAAPPASKPDAAAPAPTPDAWGPMADAPAPMTPPTGGPADAAPAPAPDMAAAPAASACPPGVDALSLLARRCGNCHGERMPAKALDLVTPGLADRVVGVKSTCQNKPLLDPDAPESAPAGHLLDKMAGPVPGCGAQMPYGTPALTPAETDCLVEWSARVIARAKKGN